MPFNQGNSKLGKKIWTWSIPAGDTCPGKTEACSKECYAAAGFFLMPNVAKALGRNWDQTKDSSFVKWAVDEIKRIGAKVLRVHVAGDLYSVDYARKWLEIFKQSPQCRFFLYTRSWRLKRFRGVLKQIAACKNVRFWWSVDKDTPTPKYVPKAVKLAYMQTEVTDIPHYEVDLVFRTDNLRDSVVKKVNNAMVCPVENGITTDMTCMKCGYCFRDRGEVIDYSKSTDGKIALELMH